MKKLTAILTSVTMMTTMLCSMPTSATGGILAANVTPEELKTYTLLDNFVATYEENSADCDAYHVYETPDGVKPVIVSDYKLNYASIDVQDEETFKAILDKYSAELDYDVVTTVAHTGLTYRLYDRPETAAPKRLAPVPEPDDSKQALVTEMCREMKEAGAISDAKFQGLHAMAYCHSIGRVVVEGSLIEEQENISAIVDTYETAVNDRTGAFIDIPVEVYEDGETDYLYITQRTGYGDDTMLKIADAVQTAYPEAEVLLYISPLESSDNGGVIETEAIDLLEDVVLPPIKNLGDTNLDGVVSVKDVIYLSKYIANILTFNPEQLAAADCTADGVINNNDVYALMMYLVGEIEAFPVAAE